MKKILYFLCFLPSFLLAQTLDSLTIEKIMSDPKWIGTSPSHVFWSSDNQEVYFNWNPDQVDADSLYKISLKERNPIKVTPEERSLAMAERWGTWNQDRTKRVFVEGNTLYVRDLTTNSLTPLIRTMSGITRPQFLDDGNTVVFQQGMNLFDKNLGNGRLTQLTNFRKGQKNEKPKLTEQKAFLKEDALKNSRILQERKANLEKAKKNRYKSKEQLRAIYIGNNNLNQVKISPDRRFVHYQLQEPSKTESTFVPNYVTESGNTENLTTRPVVGSPQAPFTSYIYDTQRDSIYPVEVEGIPGIKDIPAFYEDYPEKLEALKKDPQNRSVYISEPIWNDKGSRAFVVIRALNFKDRWIMELDSETGKLKLLDRQHDDAWIAGPGIGYAYSTGNVGWLDEDQIWFQSEESGYSHLYGLSVKKGKKKALTQGKYEVQQAVPSLDKKSFYITTNEVHPGQNQFYTLDVATRKQERITQMEGGNQVIPSPNEKHLAFLFSTSTHPAELYLQNLDDINEPEQITDKAVSAEFASYPWRTPEIITFKDRDGFDVYAEVYHPTEPAASKPGVIFVHGAGYLQDVKQSWSSSYFREHLFMNLLADHGYQVMNIDYRGSSGYGSKWRTAIYRHMGKNDLADIEDGARFMVSKYGVNPDNIGLWGGSYGGFMTLMALFTTDTFKAGGALRSVTDWAHYNHGYTSQILNNPQDDPESYDRSSPINFAEGFKRNLLMAHGMIDTNVHFQDIVRLSQRLIELGKDNWELAVYPVEDHGFVEPSSWTDEYKRIFKLFEAHLK